jgi:hypothetical protein
MFSPSGVVQGDLWDHQKRPQPKACCGDLRAKAKQPGAGLRRDETAKLPDDFGPIISRRKVITQQATEVLRLQLRPRCEQERRDKADTAVMQAARQRVRAELRQGK